MSAAERIAELRSRIDALDKTLVALLNERARLALAIGGLKHEAGEAIYQPGREADVLANARKASAGPLGDDAILRLWERIIDETRRLERLAVIESEERDRKGDGHGRSDAGTGDGRTDPDRRRPVD